MNSCIYIDGFALWAVVIMFAVLFAGFIFFGNCYIAKARENDRLKSRIKHYSAQLKEYEQAEYKDGFLKDIIYPDSKLLNERSFEAGLNIGKVLGGNGNV